MAEVVAFKPNQKGGAIAAANRLFAYLESPSTEPYPDVVSKVADKRIRQEYEADDAADIDGLIEQAVEDIYDIPQVQARIDVRMHLAGHERSLLKTAAPDLRTSLDGLRLVIKSRSAPPAGVVDSTEPETLAAKEVCVEDVEAVAAGIAESALAAADIAAPGRVRRETRRRRPNPRAAHRSPSAADSAPRWFRWGGSTCSGSGW